MKKRGFTLIELLVVVTLIGILASFITINLTSRRNKTSLDGMVQQLLTDIRQQQVRSMTGKSGVVSSGVYLSTNYYVLFDGPSYNSGDSNNFVVDLPDDITLNSISFPGSEIVFLKPSGEVSGYAIGSDSFVLQSNEGGGSKSFNFNRYGVPNVN